MNYSLVNVCRRHVGQELQTGHVRCYGLVLPCRRMLQVEQLARNIRALNFQRNPDQLRIQIILLAQPKIQQVNLMHQSGI
jgi:hypothetical protein